jgi:hypothetical protein
MFWGMEATGLKPFAGAAVAPGRVVAVFATTGVVFECRIVEFTALAIASGTTLL